jgi:hypothetical protein
MKKVLGSFLVIIALITVWFTVQYNLEAVARMQNNLNLKYVEQHIVEDFTVQGKVRTDVSKEELTDSLNKYAKGLLSIGITGDIFVIRVSDKKLFWENSTDCIPGNELKLYMIKDGVCKLFKDQDSCQRAVNIMITNEPIGSVTWLFDDSPEFVNYKYIPFEVEGDKYIIGQGTQTDEIEKYFLPSYIVSALWSIVLIIFFNL